jgi:hypothetical protein
LGLPPLSGYLCNGGAGNETVRALTRSAGGGLVKANAGLQPGGAIIWGVLRGCDRLLQDAMRLGREFYYIDRPYFGRRNKPSQYRVTRGGLQAGKVLPRPDDRWKLLRISLQPWRHGGREIIVCPPTLAMIAFWGEPARSWLSETLNVLAQHTDRPIVIRQKPGPKHNMPDLEEVLRTAHAVVTFNSNAAVEAVLAGVPVFTTELSAAAPVGLTDLSRIEEPIRPDREPWCHHLAYGQFTQEEMRDGTALSLAPQGPARRPPLAFPCPDVSRVSDDQPPRHRPTQIAVITSFSQRLYESYAWRFLESFERFWPKDVKLYVYTEDCIPRTVGEVRNLLQCCPELVAFKQAHAQRTIDASGAAKKGFRFDAIRFAHKVFAILHGTRNVNADKAFWIDADVVTFSPIPHTFLDSCLPDDCYTACLKRDNSYSECGFVGYNLRHPIHEEFMKAWEELYTSGRLFELSEWHDSYVYDHIRRNFETQGKLRSHDLSGAHAGAAHPFVNCDLGRYMDHLKGRRKLSGKSRPSDLSVARPEEYWQ